MHELASLGAAGGDDEVTAFELARRAEASEIGYAVVERLELITDDLAIAYPGTAPAGWVDAACGRHSGHIGPIVTSRHRP